MQTYWIHTTFHLAMLLAGCDKSPLGPHIAGQPLPTSSDYPSGPTSVVSEIEVSSGSVSLETLSCAQSPRRQTFYAGSLIELHFACSGPVSSVEKIGLPSFLTLTANGQNVTAIGTAPSSGQVATWSFVPSSAGRSGTSTTVNTVILPTPSLAAVLDPATLFDTTNGVQTSNGQVFDMGHKITLDTAWDGSMSDVLLKASTIASDIPGLNLAASCAIGTSPYVCNGTTSSSGWTQSGGLRLQWTWGVFDQGPYTIQVTPQVTLEGAVHSLSQLTFNATVPIQTAGNVTILPSGRNVSPNTFSDAKFRLSLAVSPSSTALGPVMGIVYPSYPGGERALFSRFTVDRSLPPSSVGQSVSALTSPVSLTSNAIAQVFGVHSLPNGQWATLGLKATALSADDVFFNRLTSDGTAPTVDFSEGLTSYPGTGMTAIDADLASAFEESGVVRQMYAWSRIDTNSGDNFLKLGKLNSYATSGQVVTAYDLEVESAAVDPLDRLRIRHGSEQGTAYVYLAYRAGSDLKIAKARAEPSGGQYGLLKTSPGLVTSVFSSSSSFENLDLALGTVGTQPTAAVVYVTQSLRCYFRRTDATLSSHSAVLTIGTGSQNCYEPKIHFNSKTGRFLVIYGERNSSAMFDIKAVEVTPGATDALAAPMTVVQNLTTLPIRLGSAFYEAGDWVALVYRLSGVDQLKFHGFHVSSY
jgi:hypothetical protein